MLRGPIYWHQGLFLQPQHFQLLNQQLPEMLVPLLARLRPYFWGLAAGGLDPSALAARRLDLLETSLLLPNSAVLLSCPGNAVCAPRIIAPETVPAEGSCLVYLGLRCPSAGEPNLTLAPSITEMANAPTRLAAPVEPEDVADLYGDGPPAQVRSLSYVLNFVFEHELEHAGNLELMPVARLVQEDGDIKLDSGYVPPCLCLSVSSVLGALVRDLLDRILGKSAQLEGYKNLSSREFISADFTLLLMALRSLSRNAARLEQMLESPCQSPWEAFGLLRELAAELSVFSVDTDATGSHWQDKRVIPSYAHEDIGHCFASVHAVIVSLLENITAAPRYVLRFIFAESYWTLRLPAELAAGTPADYGGFWLVLHSDAVTPEVLRQQVFQSLKVAPGTTMSSLLVRALPGIALIPSDGPPAGLPRRGGTCYFQLTLDDTQWEEVIKSNTLALHWSDAPADLDAQLAILSR
ncbi:type VI secretion protein, family [Thiorhodovibrio winogradskyi]|uniref:Type VI secretion protein, family n=1 Tax=Thiorhodovibrio winogradskyi TaxID=77007 RepID=A0ABZ0S7Y6_9GAMM|nr:type VI secretion system baseplate subunit TssK [Thiorhodovibrio winogradskyi]